MIRASRVVIAVASGIIVALPPRAAAAGANQHEIRFRDDDHKTQLIARTLLGKNNLQEEDLPSETNALQTAWVNTSDSARPTLFVMYGCSPTGNCELNGFERARTGYRLVLDSLAQRCWTLRSSHAGHRDLAAYMHGSAFDGTRKIYWWRGGRYVQVSQRGARSPD